MLKAAAFEEGVGVVVVASRFKVDVVNAFLVEPLEVVLHQGDTDALRAALGQYQQVAKHAERVSTIFFDVDDTETQ